MPQADRVIVDVKLKGLLLAPRADRIGARTIDRNDDLSFFNSVSCPDGASRRLRNSRLELTAIAASAEQRINARRDLAFIKLNAYTKGDRHSKRLFRIPAKLRNRPWSSHCSRRPRAGKPCSYSHDIVHRRPRLLASSRF